MSKDMRIQIIIGAKDEASKTFKITNQNLKQLSTSLSQASRKFAVAGAAMAAGLGVAIKKTGDFQEQMSFVSTMLGDQSEKFMPSFSNALKDMSKTYGQSTKTLSDGLYDILSASIPAEQALGVLQASVKAAEAGFVEAGLTADALTTVINAYGLAVEEAGDVSDWFFSIVEKGKTTMAELAPVIGLVLPLSKQLGVSLEEVGASLTVMTRAGINTNIAVTSLRSLMGAFLKPTKELKKEVKAWGFESSQAAMKSLGLEGVIKKLIKVDAVRLPQLIEEKRALTGLLTLIDKSNEFIEDKISITNRAGKTDEMFAKRQENLNTQLRQLKETFNVLMIEIGTRFIPVVKDLIKYLKDNAAEITEFVEKNGELVVKLGLLIPALTIFVGVMLKVGSVVLGAYNAFMLLLPVLGAIASALAPYAVLLVIAAASFTTLAITIGKAKTATEELNDATEQQLVLVDLQKTKAEEWVGTHKALLLVKANLLQRGMEETSQTIINLDKRIAKLRETAETEKRIAKEVGDAKKVIDKDVAVSKKILTDADINSQKMAQATLLSVAGNVASSMLELAKDSSGKISDESKGLAKAQVLIQQGVALANIWAVASLGGPLAVPIAAASSALILPNIIGQLAAIDSAGAEHGAIIDRPTNIRAGEGYKKEIIMPLTSGLPASAISIQNIIIQFPNVSSVQDWIDLPPSEMKEITRRKILVAFNALAREGIFLPTRS